MLVNHDKKIQDDMLKLKETQHAAIDEHHKDQHGDDDHDHEEHNE